MKNGRRGLWLVAGVSTFAVSSLLGAAAGVGTYTFYYADGGSYVTNNPAACANCHVMQSHYDAWHKSSHHAVAVCNDCHAPHDSFVGKWYCKGRNGFFHSLAFTTGDYPDEILMHDYNRRITEQACRDCHAPITHEIETIGVSGGEQLSCIRCHSDVGHPR